MGVFEALHNTSENAINSGEQYVHATRSYYKLKAFKYLTKSLSSFILILSIGSLVSIGLIFLLIAITIWLSEVMDSVILACLILSTIIFVLAALVFISRKSIDRLVITKVGEDYFNS